MPTARMLLRALVPVGVAIGVALSATTAQAEPTVEEQITTSSAALERVVEDYNRVNAQLAASRQTAAVVTARLVPLQQQLDTALASVGDLAVDAYVTGRGGALSALLDSGSAAGLLDRVYALDQVAHARNGEVAAVVAAQARVTEEKRRLDTLVAAQAASAVVLAKRKAQIEQDLDKLYDLREQAYGAAQETAAETDSTPAPTPPAVSGKAGIAVNFAYAALGKPYVWAADGPEGYDCSGLTLAAWRAAGVSLTHAVSVQWTEVTHIGRSQLAPGDLVFYSDLGHIAIYVGSGKVIHAPTFGEVVKISTVDMMPPYGYGRPS